MVYTMLTVVSRLKTPPKVGEDLAVGIREIGCAKCVVDRVDGTLKVCWKHNKERVLWGVTIDDDEQTVQAEGLPHLGDAPRIEEPVEVP